MPIKVFTNGCFDVLHVGHIRLLEKAKQLGDILIVGINSDESVRALKGKGRPVNKLENRIEMLRALKFVDEVVIFGEPNPYNLIQAIQPDIIVKGGDYTPDQVVGNDLAKVVIIPFVDGYSSTKIIEKIKSL